MSEESGFVSVSRSEADGLMMKSAEVLEKRAWNEAASAGVGGLVGLLAGLASDNLTPHDREETKEERRRRLLEMLLSGALLGAGAGYGGHVVAKGLNLDSDSGRQFLYDAFRKAFEDDRRVATEKGLARAGAVLGNTLWRGRNWRNVALGMTAGGALGELVGGGAYSKSRAKPYFGLGGETYRMSTGPNFHGHEITDLHRAFNGALAEAAPKRTVAQMDVLKLFDKTYSDKSSIPLLDRLNVFKTDQRLKDLVTELDFANKHTGADFTAGSDLALLLENKPNRSPFTSSKGNRVARFFDKRINGTMPTQTTSVGRGLEWLWGKIRPGRTVRLGDADLAAYRDAKSTLRNIDRIARASNKSPKGKSLGTYLGWGGGIAAAINAGTEMYNEFGRKEGD